MTASPLRAYVDDINDLPRDVLLGRIVLFKITDEPVKRDDIVQWFTELQLDPTLLPSCNKYIDAFKKATSAVDGDKYPMSQDRTGHVLSRDLGSTRDVIRRQITREIKDARNKRLSYDAAIECTFFRPSDPKNQTTAGLRIVVRPEALESGELDAVRAIARDIRDQYERYYDYLDGQKLRATVRNYLKKLNAIEIKGGVYFVHATRDDELARLTTLVSRFGGDCHMQAIPIVDLKREREFIIEAFEREASQSLRDITKEAKELLSNGRSITAASYARLKTSYDEVMGNAEEHMLNLQINQDVTAAAAEVAFNTLRKLQEGMLQE